MKRLCSFAVLMALCSSAYAGGSISFTVGGHRVHIESSRHCRSTSCASVSVSGVNERRSRSITDREEVTPVRTAPPVSQTVSPPPAPAPAPPAQTIVASPPTVYKPAASTTQIVAPPPSTAACSTGLHSLAAATSAAASTGCKTGRTRAAAGAGRKGFT